MNLNKPFATVILILGLFFVIVTGYQKISAADAPAEAVSEDTIFVDHRLSTGRGSSIVSVDLDGDNDVDVIGTAWIGSFSDYFLWWENDGSGGFTQHTISNDYAGAQHVYPFDIDNDDDLDLVTIAYRSSPVPDDYWPGIHWWENDGDENFVRHLITEKPYLGEAVFVIDMDGDKDGDVLYAAASSRFSSIKPVVITWWENQGASGWVHRSIGGSFEKARSVFGIDLDQDTDVDILYAQHGADEISWWENDGSQSFTLHVIAADFDGASSVMAVDLDKDNDLDVLAGAIDAKEVAWWENDGDENFTKHSIGSESSVHSVYTADVDDDGDLDVMSAGVIPSIWWNDGSQNFTWQKLGVLMETVDIHAADLDADDDLDIVVASDSTGFHWMENGQIQPAAFPYYNDFESGELGFEWTLDRSAGSIIGVHSGFPLYSASGEKALRMGDRVKTDSATHAQAVLYVDLSGQSDVMLGFLARETPDPNTTKSVSISGDGANWHQVLGSEHVTDAWGIVSVDLAAAATANGIPLNDQFRIKFEFAGDGSSGDHDSDYGVDDIIIDSELFWPVIGLETYNDSPTGLGSTTVLTSTILAGTDVVYSWDLGDGTNLSGQNVDYIYPALGVYTATLTATNSQNVLTDTTTLEIVIPVPISDLSATNDGPLPVDTPVRLEATVTAGTSIDYFWDYGDGETGTGRVKDHAYSAPGFYTAVVTATNTENSMTAQTNVEVVEQPECQQFEFGEDGLKTNFYLPYVENFDSAFHLDVDTIKTNAKLSAETSRKLHISVHVNDELVLACSPTVLPEAYYYLCSTTADFKLLKNENIKYTIGGEGSPIGSIEDVNFLEFCTVEQDSYLYLPGILR